MNFFSILLPIMTALLLLVFYLTLPDLRRCVLPGATPPPPPARPRGRRLAPEEDRSRALTRRDALPILAVTLLYALTAFFRLGSTVEPQSFAPMAHRQAELEIPAGAQPIRLWAYPGVGMGGYELAWSADGEDYHHLADFTQDHIAVLKWAPIDLAEGREARFLRITCTYGEPWLGELVLLDADGQPIPVRSSVPELCDEPEKAHLEQSFLTSTYFDEIYHARTAWEHLHGVWPYEVTHPPLGKEIMGLGILLFGMTPFGWRFSGTLFGVLMLPLLYIFLKKLFGGRFVPCCGTVLFATDFMHYVQTRIATIDTYSVFFILLMYLFFYIWLSEDKLWALRASGIAFGLGAAAKWTSLYAGAGLGGLWALEWFGRLWTARRQDWLASLDEDPEAPKPDRPSALRGALLAFGKNVLFCLLFFVLIPGGIYVASYLPYARAAGTPIFSKDYLVLVWNNQVSMFTYHSKTVLGSTHPYSSLWYQWLLDLKPILYVLEYPTPDTKISIAAWLSPLLCWGGLLGLPVLIYLGLFRHDRRAGFIWLGYLAQLLPWVGIERLTFAYHYFPSSLFLVLGLSYMLALLRENRPGWRGEALALTAGSVALFALFFPALNGLEISRELSTQLLKWLPLWPL